MKHLIVGGDGMVGKALRDALGSRGIPFDSTTRRYANAGDQKYLDLRDALVNWPDARYDAVYLVAAVPKFADCERDSSTWAVNVDAPIALARVFKSAFKVFVSSDAVEFASGMAYGRQKAHVESYMQSIDAAIARPGRIEPTRANEFAEFLISLASGRRAGVSRWN